MNDIAAEFQTYRRHLRAIACRMLGSQSEANDAVQQAWLHLTRSRAGGIQNLGGWLTTVVVRVCLDMLRSRQSRREDPLRDDKPNVVPQSPEHDAVRADSISLALHVVLQTLTPAERVALVLHEVFDLSFDELAPLVCRSSVAARQLASRARRRVHRSPVGAEARVARRREVVETFLAATRAGDLQALLELLCPDTVGRTNVVGGVARHRRTNEEIR